MQKIILVCIIKLRKSNVDEINRNGGIMEVTRSRYLNELVKNQKNGLIKVITGIARCGRTYLLFNSYYDYLISKGVGESHIIELPLEDRSYKRFRTRDKLVSYVKDKIDDQETYYVLLDEMQLLDDYAGTLADLLRIPNLDIYITSGDLEFLYKDIIGVFGDRCYEIKVGPMSFKEVVFSNEGDTARTIDNYLIYGGLPMVWWMSDVKDKKKYLTSAVRESYIPELVQKYSIKSEEEFEQLFVTLARELGELTNPLKLAKENSDKTVKKYIEYFSGEFLLNKVLRYDIKKKKVLSTPAKYYFEDIGLRNAILGFKDLNEGKLAENIIYNELKLRGYEVNIGVVELNYKSEEGKNKKKQLEVNFIAKKGDKKYYIQSAYANTIGESEQIQKDKQKILCYVKDSFKKIIVVKESVGIKRDEYGFLTIGLRDFLMNENSLEL